MISVKLKKSKEILEVHAEGHALFDKKGKDIVCASASVLIESWCLSEKELCLAEIEINRKSGRLEAEVHHSKEADVLLFKSLALSLLTLEKQYPENIIVIVEDDNGR